MTIDEAKQRAADRVRRDLEMTVAFRAKCQLLKEESRRRRTERKTRRLECLAPLPSCRVFITGPRWRQRFGVELRALADVAPQSTQFHPDGRKILIYDFEDDVRELVLVPIRGELPAMWSDPREQLGLRTP